MKYFLLNKGADAVYEAIAYLRIAGALEELTMSRGLRQAARDHAYDIGPKNEVSHIGTDHSTMCDRIERYGVWNNAVAENISLSEITGKDIILQFIIDDGNPKRSHRKNIFSQE